MAGRYVNSNDMSEVKVTPQQDQAYRALYKAAERMGANNYQTQKTAWLKKHRSMYNFRFTATPEHREICDTLPQILSGEVTPEYAMGLLWQYDTMQQRLGQ